MRALQRWTGGILLLFALTSCAERGSSPSAGQPSAAPPVASGIASGAVPAFASASAAPAAPTPPAPAEPTAASPDDDESADDDDGLCMTAALSMERAKPHKPADAPYAECAAGLSSHCGGGDGKRGHLCSIPLDVARTKLTRKTKPGLCCYGSSD